MLLTACSNGDLGQVKTLVEKEGADVTATDEVRKIFHLSCNYNTYSKLL